MEHLAKTVLQFVIVAVSFQLKKAVKCAEEMRIRLESVFLCADSVPEHLRKFVIRVGIALFGGTFIEMEGLFVVLFHALTPIV